MPLLYPTPIELAPPEGASLQTPPLSGVAWEEHQYQGSDGLWLNYVSLRPRHATPTGRALLMFMGLGGTEWAARPFLQELAVSFDALIVIDQRGYGRNHFAFETLRSVRQLFKDAEAWIASQRSQFEPQHPLEWSIIGLSLGGLLATLLAKAYPKQFSRVILLAPAFAGNPAVFSPLFVAKTVWRFAIGKLPTMALPYGLDALTRRPKEVQEALGQHWHEFAAPGETKPLLQPTRFMLSMLPHQWLAAWQLKRLRQSICLVLPGQDKVIDSSHSMALFATLQPAAFGRHWLLEYPLCYHDLVLEPEFATIAQDIRAWLQLVL